MPIRSTILFIVCCMVGAVLYFTALAIFSFTTSMYPRGALWYLPWSLGLCGLLGLFSTLRSPDYKTPLWHKTEIVLLSLGIAGALCFLLISLVIVRSYGFSFPNPAVNLYGLILVTGMLVPIVFAISGILTAYARLRASDGVSRQQSTRMLLFVAALVCAVPVSRVLAQELVMFWYGRNLVAAAQASAQEIAAGAPYCFWNAHDAASIEALNKRQVLIDAVDKRYGFHGMNDIGADPHFGIQVNGREFWWSFRSREFLALPGRNFSHKFRDCDEP